MIEKYVQATCAGLAKYYNSENIVLQEVLVMKNMTHNKQ